MQPQVERHRLGPGKPGPGKMRGAKGLRPAAIRASCAASDRRMRFLAVRLTVFALVTLNSWAPGLRSAPGPMRGIGERQDIQAALAGAIRAALRAHVQPGKGVLSEAENADLQRLYGLENHTPVWSDRSGRLRRDARAALAILARAGEDGLDPGDYGSARLDRRSQALTPALPSFIDDLAAFDVGLSGGMLRYFRHLHLGRLDPRAIGFRLAAPPEPHDFVGALREGLADHRLEAAAAALRPALAQYQALRNALAEYRALARAPAVEEPLPDSPGILKPGDIYGGLAALQRRLAAAGDLPPDQPVATGAAPYTGAVVEGVRRFQARHGLQPDGIVGLQTRATLRVPLGWRVRQIELALERLRWLPDLGARRLIALNIPMFRLWAWDSLSPSAAPSLSMRARRPRSEHADAGLCRCFARRDLPAVLDRTAVDRQERDPACPRTRAGLPWASRHGDRP